MTTFARHCLIKASIENLKMNYADRTTTFDWMWFETTHRGGESGRTAVFLERERSSRVARLRKLRCLKITRCIVMSIIKQDTRSSLKYVERTHQGAMQSDTMIVPPGTDLSKKNSQFDFSLFLSLSLNSHLLIGWLRSIAQQRDAYRRASSETLTIGLQQLLHCIFDFFKPPVLFCTTRFLIRWEAPIIDCKE